MLLKVSTAFTRLFFLGATGLTPNVTISKAAAAFAAATNAIAELANGWYTLALAAGDLDTPGQLAYHLDAGTPTDFEDQVVPAFFGDVVDANVTKWLSAAVLGSTSGEPFVSVASMSGNVISAAVLDVSAVLKIWQSGPLAEQYPADGAEGSAGQLLYAILQCLTEFSIAGPTLTVKKLDGTTPAMTFTLSPAGNPTARSRAT